MTAVLLAPHNEIAWAAGLFEGEGCARVRLNGASVFKTPTASLGMTDEYPVRRFHEIVGFGHVRTEARKTPNPRARTLWRWESSSKVDLPKFAAFLPWLSPRRREAVEAMIAVCIKADRTEVNRAILARLPKGFCECGRGPLPLGALGRHRKACRA